MKHWMYFACFRKCESECHRTNFCFNLKGSEESRSYFVVKTAAKCQLSLDLSSSTARTLDVCGTYSGIAWSLPAIQCPERGHANCRLETRVKPKFRPRKMLLTTTNPMKFKKCTFTWMMRCCNNNALRSSSQTRRKG